MFYHSYRFRSTRRTEIVLDFGNTILFSGRLLAFFSSFLLTRIYRICWFHFINVTLTPSQMGAVSFLRFFQFMSLQSIENLFSFSGKVICLRTNLFKEKDNNFLHLSSRIQ